MASAGALYNVGRPSGVMEAGASLGALHAAIAGKKVTAHAQGKAMSLVRTHKLTSMHLHDWNWSGQAILAIESALNLIEVSDKPVVPMVGHVIDFLEPFHFTVA
jgi:hypothetical protein